LLALENDWTDLAIFFMFVIVRIRFLRKEKLEKLPGKLENLGKTEFFLWDFCMNSDHNSGFERANEENPQEINSELLDINITRTKL
jgi:hypothetical protein